MNSKIMLAAILLIGLVLRVADINNNPPSLYGDELTIVYDAYSLLKTGHDQNGAFFPLTFSMGAGRPAAYVYGSIPFVALFGPSALGVRALSIISGLGLILLIYLLGKRLFSLKVGLAASALMAVSPWDLSLSRGGFEAHFALFLALLGTVAFILAERKPWLFLLSALSFGLTLHTYPTYKLTLPFFLILLIWFIGGFKKLNALNIRKYTILAAVILILMAVLVASQTFTGGSETRFGDINIFAQKELKENITQKINFERSMNTLPQSISKYFLNKFIEYGKVITENYLQNFSVDFLFIHGDRNPRHNMGTIGQLYLIDLVFLFFGTVNLWQRNKKALFFIIGWLIIAPMASAPVDSPHALRSALMLPPLILISAYGLTGILNLTERPKIVLLSLVGIGFIIQFVFFVQKLYFLAPNLYSNFWSYPAKLASLKALENRNNFKYIILSDKIDNVEFAYSVYAKIEPSQVINQNQKRSLLGEYKFKQFENVYIGYVPDEEIEKFINSLTGSVMFIGIGQQQNFLHSLETVEGKDKSMVLVLRKKQ